VTATATATAAGARGGASGTREGRRPWRQGLWGAACAWLPRLCGASAILRPAGALLCVTGMQTVGGVAMRCARLPNPGQCSWVHGQVIVKEHQATEACVCDPPGVSAMYECRALPAGALHV